MLTTGDQVDRRCENGSSVAAPRAEARQVAGPVGEQAEGGQRDGPADAEEAGAAQLPAALGGRRRFRLDERQVAYPGAGLADRHLTDEGHPHVVLNLRELDGAVIGALLQ